MLGAVNMAERQLKVVGGVVDKQELSKLMQELRRLGHSELEIMQLLGIKQRSRRNDVSRRKCSY